MTSVNKVLETAGGAIPPVGAQSEKKGRRATPENCSVLIWRVPRPLKDEFRLRCLKEKKSMREVIVEFMKAFVTG